MTNEIVNISISLGTGLLLGFLFFWGLWWTVQKGTSAKQPALWFLLSQIVRTSVVICGFYILGHDQPLNLLGGLLGFFFARLLATHFTQNIKQPVLMRAED